MGSSLAPRPPTAVGPVPSVAFAFLRPIAKPDKPLVAINQGLPQSELQAKHGPVLASLEPLIERGQHDGAFRADVPAAWHLSMLMALIHAASAELQAARIADTHAEAALVDTVLGAVSARPVGQP